MVLPVISAPSRLSPGEMGGQLDTGVLAMEEGGLGTLWVPVCVEEAGRELRGNCCDVLANMYSEGLAGEKCDFPSLFICCVGRWSPVMVSEREGSGLGWGGLTGGLGKRFSSFLFLLLSSFFG